MSNLLSLDQRLERIEQLLLNQKTVMTLEEACLYCNFSKSYMYKLTSGQRIPHFKPQNKAIFFKKTELDDWLLKNRVATLDEIEQKASDYITRKSVW